MQLKTLCHCIQVRLLPNEVVVPASLSALTSALIILCCVQVAAATVGLEQFGQQHIPGIEAHPAVTAFLQGSTLLASTVASLLLLRQLAGQPWQQIWPHGVSMAVLACELWYLIV